MTFYIGLSAIYIILCLIGMLLLNNVDKEIKNSKVFLAIMLMAAFVFRVVLALRDRAFYYDISCFKGWANYTVSLGMNHMYFSDVFLDYPPGYMYILRFIQLIRDAFNIPYDSVLYTAIIKTPAMIADVVSAILVYKVAKKNINEKWAVFLALAMAFCPITVFNSAVWGQIDSYYTLFLVFALYLINKDNVVGAAFVYALALLTKPQALLFGPVLLFWVLQKKDWKVFFKAVGTGILTMYVFSLPFAQGPNPIWLVDLYMNTFGGYKDFSVNAYNLYAALGLNWIPLSDFVGSELINVAVIFIAFVLCAWGYFALNNKSKIFYTAGLFITIFFAFCTMMHERYMFPVILLLFMTYIYNQKTKYLYMAMSAATLCYLNVTAVFNGGDYGARGKLPFMAILVSVATVVFAVAYIIMYIKDALSEKTFTFSKKQIQAFMLAGLMLFTAYFEFFRLGSTKAPQTFWQNESIDEEVIMVFDQPEQIRNIQSFSGIGDQFYPENEKKIGCNFDVYARSPENKWVSIANLKHDYVFTWKEENVDYVTDQILIKPNEDNQVLGEIVLRNVNNQIIKGEISKYGDFSSNLYPPDFAFDESETSPVSIDKYYYSMYFDEIYHGRTAFEQIEGYDIYETTHPPLGKLIISLGMKIFGVNPFGARVMGALRGVFIVWLMYLMAKELFGAFLPSFFTALVFSLDFMRFTQTRIATVDSFVVLFVMLMFYYMLLWAKTPFGENKTVEILSLFLSGVFMGCAVSTKWNGAYSAVGLAVVFFVALWLKSKKYMEDHPKKDTIKLAFTTCLWCVLFFVIIPFAIYFATFIPIMDAHGLKETVAEFIRWQTNMFDYHHNLEATHFFASMWYTWLIDLKPIWYSVNTVGNMTSSISAFGNPMIWIPMLFALVYVLFASVKRKDKAGFFILAGYLSSLLPWTLITRLTFIYHYFPATIFGILAIGYVIKDLLKNKKNLKFVLAYTVLVAVCFAIFFPVISGVPFNSRYIDLLELLPTWYFVN